MAQKHFLLSLLTLTLFTCCTTLQATNNEHSEKLIGKVTKQHLKNFTTGFLIGAAQGATNRIIANHLNLKKQDGVINVNGIINNDAIEVKGIALMSSTLVATQGLKAAVDIAPDDTAVWLGQGIGQFLTESVTITPSEKTFPQVTFTPRVNFAFFISSTLQIIGFLRSIEKALL